jgi:hypothetical protein
MKGGSRRKALNENPCTATVPEGRRAKSVAAQGIPRFNARKALPGNRSSKIEKACHSFGELDLSLYPNPLSTDPDSGLRAAKGRADRGAYVDCV